jgi:hypothetical protein
MDSTPIEGRETLRAVNEYWRVKERPFPEGSGADFVAGVTIFERPRRISVSPLRKEPFIRCDLCTRLVYRWLPYALLPEPWSLLTK